MENARILPFVLASLAVPNADAYYDRDYVSKPQSQPVAVEEHSCEDLLAASQIKGQVPADVDLSDVTKQFSTMVCGYARIVEGEDGIVELGITDFGDTQFSDALRNAAFPPDGGGGNPMIDISAGKGVFLNIGCVNPQTNQVGFVTGVDQAAYIADSAKLLKATANEPVLVELGFEPKDWENATDDECAILPNSVSVK